MTNENAFKLGLVFGVVYVAAVLALVACWQVNKEREALQRHILAMQQFAPVKEKFQRIPIEDQPEQKS